MAEETTKRRALQVLLDTGNLAGELFDELESDSFELTREWVARLGVLHDRLTTLHTTFLTEYALSGRAAHDLMRSATEQLRTSEVDRRRQERLEQLRADQQAGRA